MSRDYSAGSSADRRDDTLATAYPISMSCWAKCPDVTSSHSLYFMCDNASNATAYGFQGRGNDAGDPARFLSPDTVRVVNSTNGYTANNWHQYTGVGLSATSRTVWLDGAGKATTTGNQVWQATNRVSVGALLRLSPIFSITKVAECAIWNIALSDADVALLAPPNSYSPLLVQPANLIAYWPLGGPNYPNDTLDKSGNGKDLNVVVGSPVFIADHPTITYSVGNPMMHYKRRNHTGGLLHMGM